MGGAEFGGTHFHSTDIDVLRQGSLNSEDGGRVRYNGDMMKSMWQKLCLRTKMEETKQKKA